MISVTLTIDKAKVYDEVSQTTSYTGSKMENDEDGAAYERIFTTEYDQSQLDRFWNESCVSVCEVMKKFLQTEETTDQSFTIYLELSSAFDQALEKSMTKELFSFFVMNIVAKWYSFTNKKEASEYSTAAISFLEGVHRKACYKKKPRRPTYT